VQRLTTVLHKVHRGGGALFGFKRGGVVLSSAQSTASGPEMHTALKNRDRVPVAETGWSLNPLQPKVFEVNKA